MVPAHRFLFRGEAVGVAGHIRRPVDVVIPSQASVSLPIIGGRAVSAVNGGSFGDTLSFASAVVTAYGDYVPLEKAVGFTKGNHGKNRLASLTRVTTEVRDLSVVSSDGRSRGHTLTVARLYTFLESSHLRQGEEPSFTTELKIDGIAIDGEPIDIEWADDLIAVKRYRDLHATPSTRGSKSVTLRSRLADLFETGTRPGTREKAGASPPEYEICTGCREIRAPKKFPAKVLGPNRLHLKDFGTIYIAEMVLSPVDRRLALLRIELGSPKGGDVLSGGSGLDGHDWPP